VTVRGRHGNSIAESTGRFATTVEGFNNAETCKGACLADLDVAAVNCISGQSGELAQSWFIGGPGSRSMEPTGFPANDNLADG
jgi:hypothetical protein